MNPITGFRVRPETGEEASGEHSTDGGRERRETGVTTTTRGGLVPKGCLIKDTGVRGVRRTKRSLEEE